MKKLLICLATAGLVIFIAACGTTEPEQLPDIDIAYTPAEEPPAPSLSSPAPTPPLAPPVPSLLEAEPEVAERPCQFPVPAQPLSLPLVPSTIYAGQYGSTVITEDGNLWLLGMFFDATRWVFAQWIVWMADEGLISIYTDDGDAFTPSGNFGYGGANRIFLYCYHTPFLRHVLGSLTVIDQDGNEIDFDRFSEIHAESQSVRLHPVQVEENVASARLHSWHSDVNLINGYGQFVINGDWEEDEYGEWFQQDNIYVDDVVDFVVGRHVFGYGVGGQRHLNIDYALLFADGSFELITSTGERRSFFDANIISIAYGNDQMFFLGYDGQLLVLFNAFAYTYWGPEVMKLDVAQISVSDDHRLALTNDGRLYAWGLGNNGQLGNGGRQTQHTPVFIKDNIVAISAGDAHSMAIDADGVLWGWGFNMHGQIGVGGAVQHFFPVQVMEDVAAVSAGYSHTIAVTNDGTLWAWGSNSYGQLGDGTRYTRREPVQIMTGVRLP